MVTYTPTNMVVLLLTLIISHQVFGRDVGYIETNKTGGLYHEYSSPRLATETVEFKYLRIRLTRSN